MSLLPSVVAKRGPLTSRAVSQSSIERHQLLWEFRGVARQPRSEELDFERSSLLAKYCPRSLQAQQIITASHARRKMFTSATRRCLTFRSRPVTRFATATRQLQVSSRQQYPRKDAQDKDSLAPESNEYSKSGSDAQSAATEEAAFSGDKTRPEEQEQHAAKESGGVSVLQDVQSLGGPVVAVRYVLNYH